MFCSPMKLHHCAWLPPWPKKQSMHALDAVDAVDAVHFSPTFEWSVVEVQSLIKASILRWSIKGVHTKHGNEDDEVDLKLTNWSAEWDSPLCTEAILSYMTRTWKEDWTKSNKLEKDLKRQDSYRFFMFLSCSCHNLTGGRPGSCIVSFRHGHRCNEGMKPGAEFREDQSMACNKICLDLYGTESIESIESWYVLI